ncbi:MAG: hypothetical protein AAGL24_16565 [Pseudomonadota bacterium]
MFSNWPFRRPRSAQGTLLFALAIASLGFSIALLTATVFARFFGLGLAEDFIVYRWIGWDRSETAIGLALATIVSFGLLFAVLFDWRRGARFRELAQNTALSLASILVCLLFLEIAFRMLNDIALWPLENHIAREQALLRTQTANQYDPLLGWVLRPGIRSNPDNPQTSFTTGEHGIRMNSSVPRPLPTGAILAVGDSLPPDRKSATGIHGPPSWNACSARR